MTMTAISCRVNTVEEIDAAVHRLKDVRRGSDAHQVSRFLFREMRNHRIEDTVHLLVTLTDRKSADRVAVAVHLRDRIRMRDPDILEGSALIDAEQKLFLIDGIRQGI